MHDIKFDKANSIFKSWQNDTKSSLAASLKIDVTYWRANRIVKNDNDLQAVISVLEKKFESLKNMFIDLISSGDNWPNVGTFEFNSFIN